MSTGSIHLLNWWDFHLNTQVKSNVATQVLKKSGPYQRLYAWPALQRQADRITKIWEQHSDDNCFQLCFIPVSFLVLSAAAKEGKEEGKRRHICNHTRLHLPAPLLNECCLEQKCGKTVCPFVWSLMALKREGCIQRAHTDWVSFLFLFV